MFWVSIRSIRVSEILWVADVAVAVPKNPSIEAGPFGTVLLQKLWTVWMVNSLSFKQGNTTEMRPVQNTNNMRIMRNKLRIMGRECVAYHNGTVLWYSICCMLRVPRCIDASACHMGEMQAFALTWGPSTQVSYGLIGQGSILAGSCCNWSQEKRGIFYVSQHQPCLNQQCDHFVNYISLNYITLSTVVDWLTLQLQLHCETHCCIRLDFVCVYMCVQEGMPHEENRHKSANAKTCKNCSLPC